MKKKPCFLVDKETKCSMFGSWATTALSASVRAFIAGNEMSCGACEPPPAEPVSCCGKRPFGITM